jgi:ketosteroid isomerase-like protein
MNSPVEGGNVPKTVEISRRDLLRKGLAGAAVGTLSLVAPGLAKADVSHGSEQVGEIYELQAAFHRAKTTQDLDLMMSLWADDATFVNRANGHTYSGPDEIRSFWQGSGSFMHHRFSLVPSYKTQIEVHGDEAFLYFECHDVGEFSSGSFGDPSVNTIVNDSFLAGTLRNVGGNWLFWSMTAGSSSPLSYDRYYYP